MIEAISPVAKQRFAFDPASNIIDPAQTTETPASRPRPVRPERTLPVEVSERLRMAILGHGTGRISMIEAEMLQTGTRTGVHVSPEGCR
nr:hypothetical protein [Burkholderia ambifaria]